MVHLPTTSTLNVWVTYHMSLTWNKAIKGDNSPYIHYQLWVSVVIIYPDFPFKIPCKKPSFSHGFPIFFHTQPPVSAMDHSLLQLRMAPGGPHAQVPGLAQGDHRILPAHRWWGTVGDPGSSKRMAGWWFQPLWKQSKLVLLCPIYGEKHSSHHHPDSELHGKMMANEEFKFRWWEWRWR